jgi:carbon storage regulator
MSTIKPDLGRQFGVSQAFQAMTARENEPSEFDPSGLDGSNRRLEETLHRATSTRLPTLAKEVAPDQMTKSPRGGYREFEFSLGTPGKSSLNPNTAMSLGQAGMLVLSRHQNESIIIGDNIVITIVSIVGDKVRLGIDAPRDVSVHREEVYEAIKRKEAEDAAKPDTTDETDNEGLSYTF